MSMICSSLQWLLEFRAKEAEKEKHPARQVDGDDGLPDWLLDGLPERAGPDEGSQRAQEARARHKSGASSSLVGKIEGAPRRPAALSTTFG